MVEELQVIKEIFNNATNSALVAYALYLFVPVVKTAIIVFPIVSVVKFALSKVTLSDEKN